MIQSHIIISITSYKTLYYPKLKNSREDLESKKENFNNKFPLPR